jgi:membrane protease YdiL (CAAX protease family)
MSKIKIILLGEVILFLLAIYALGFLLIPIIQKPFEKIYTPLLFIVNGILDLIIAILVFLLFVKIVDKETLSSVGIQLKNHNREFLIGGLSGIICIIIGFVFIIGRNYQQIEIVPIRMYYLLGCFIMFLLGAIQEELMCRAYILRRLTSSFSIPVSLLISSILFMALHFMALRVLSPSVAFISALNIVLAGVLLGLLYLSTKNIWLPVGFHLFWNYSQTILGFNVSGEGLPSVFNLNFKEMNLFNGGDFGFEGSYVCSIILTLAVILFYWKCINQRRV